MRKILFMMIFALLVSLNPLVSHGATSTKEVEKEGITTIIQRVYESPSVDSKTITGIEKDQLVTILAIEKGWYQIKYGKLIGWIPAQNAILLPPMDTKVTLVKKYGYATKFDFLYGKPRSVRSDVRIDKYQKVYIESYQDGWYYVKIGKYDGYLKEGVVKTGKAPTKRKVYKDGWVAPVLKSKWSKNWKTNFKTLQDELGFYEGGRVYGVRGASRNIIVNDGGGSEVTFKFYGWTDKNIPESYRIPIVAKELFKLYFEKDANRVWNYFNKGNIPDKFTANGRVVKVTFLEVDGSLYVEVGRKK